MKNDRNSFDVVMVGGGPAGIHALAELAVRARQGRPSLPQRIAVVDPAISPDGGSAHSDESPAFRVNMRLELHDVKGFMPFASFLDQFGGGGADAPLRADLAHYVSFVKMAAVRELESAGFQVRFLRATAVALIRESYGYTVALDRESTLRAKHAILATGNPAPSIPPNVRFADGSIDRVLFYNGRSDFARSISPRDRLLVIGMGPGGIDVARHLIEVTGIAEPVHLVSRNGLFSAVQTAAPLDASLVTDVSRAVVRLSEAPAGKHDLELIAAAFRPLFVKYDPSVNFGELARAPHNLLAHLAEQIEAAASGGPPWRQVIEAIGRFAPEVWRLISPEAQVAFMRDWSRLYYVKRHAMPMSSARWLAAQLAMGRMEGGQLGSEITVSREGVSAMVNLRPGGARQMLYDRLVIATGPEYRLSKSRNPLIRQLVDSGLARPSVVQTDGNGEFELGGFLTQDLELIGLPGVYGMGANVRGEDFAVHSFPALARHAAGIMDGIERRLSEPTTD